ncbi:MAG: hypothetical protein IKS21_00960 [Oscillospiraceae bacterium]|nr:hypothetical protein [Oscillospiraceae bacterium]
MKRMLLAVLFGAMMLLAGCTLQSESLYALPERSPTYRELEKAVQTAKGSASYSAPVSGTNRSAIQQQDLDGDGVNEFLVFCKIDGVRPLRVLIFHGIEERYELMCTLESDGTAFDSVQYAQIDGQPGQEILISRRIGEQVQPFLSVYTMNGKNARELLSSAYTAYSVVDLDRNLRSDLFVLRANPGGPCAYAELYRFQDGELRKDPEASLSTAADSVKRLLTGNVAKDVPAVFVASTYDERNLITDVFILKDRSFVNITQNAESGQSAQTVRNYYVYSTDIDNDGLIELPNTIELPAVEGDPQSDGQYRIVWYNLNPNGACIDKISTYHNYSEGWFLYLPEEWFSSLRVTKHISDTLTGTELFRLEQDGTHTSLVTIYAFSGEQAPALSEQDGRVLLTQRGKVYYSALISEASGLTLEMLRDRFSFISPDLFPDNG